MTDRKSSARAPKTFDQRNKRFYNGQRMYWKKHNLKNVNSCWNTKIDFYFATSQNSNLYLNVGHFSTPVLIRYLLQFNAVFFLSCIGV